MVMTRGKVGFLIISLLALIAVILIPIFMGVDFSGKDLAAYIVAKVIIVGLLIASVCYTLLSPSLTGSRGIVLIMGFVFQIVPLGLRYILASSSDTKYVWYIVILVLVLITYVGLAFGLSAQNKRMNEREEISKPKEIEIQEEKRLATDDSEEAK